MQLQDRPFIALIVPKVLCSQITTSSLWAATTMETRSIGRSVEKAFSAMLVGLDKWLTPGRPWRAVPGSPHIGRGGSDNDVSVGYGKEVRR